MYIHVHTPDCSIDGMLEMIWGSTDFPPRALARRSRLVSPAMALLQEEVEKFPFIQYIIIQARVEGVGGAVPEPTTVTSIRSILPAKPMPDRRAWFG